VGQWPDGDAVSGVDDLVAFVRARLNEREALLLHTRASDILCPIPTSTLLAEVRANRRILDDIASYADESSLLTDGMAARTLVQIAQPYAGQDGWREEWRA
jgi:hypothetical protein